MVASDHTAGRQPGLPGLPGLPMAAKALLIHRPPMLLVAGLTARAGDRATAVATLPVAGVWVADGQVLPEYFIELIAQTTALANGYDCWCAGVVPRDGMLVGVDSFTLHPLAAAGELRIEIRKVFEFGAVRVIEGEVYAAATLLARGEIKIWENLGDG